MSLSHESPATYKEGTLLKSPMPKSRKSARVDDRKILNAIFYVLRTGMPWRDLPEHCGWGKNKMSLSRRDSIPPEAASIRRGRSLSQSSWQPDAPLIRFPQKPVNPTEGDTVLLITSRQSSWRILSIRRSGMSHITATRTYMANDSQGLTKASTIPIT
jgi:hypothetical protein